MKKTILLSCFFMCLLETGITQSLLDPTFGTNGIVKTDLGSGFNYNNVGKQVFVQPDGSIYLVFESRYHHDNMHHIPYPTSIEKILPGGARDVTYGHNGLSVPVPIYESHAAIQSDGKIIVAGYTLDAGSAASGSVSRNIIDMAITRFNIDGTLDNSFNDGMIQVLNQNSINFINALTIQNDGKIIIAGFNTGILSGNINLILASINTDGSVAATSDEGSIATNYIPNSIAMQSDGKIIVGGSESGLPSIRRFSNNGSVDLTFNSTGVQLVNFGPGGYTSSIAVQPDDKIIVGGYTYNGTDGDFKVVRLNADGSLDNTFDGDAVQTIDFGRGEDSLNAIALQSDGKIVVAGNTSNGGNTDFALARLNTDGSLDHTFSADGKQTTDFGLSNDDANSIAIQSNGKLIAVGNTVEGVYTRIAAARYNSDGTPDISFDGDGMLVSLIEQGDTHYACTAIQTDGKIVAAGYTWNGNRYNFAVARYNTDGSLDNTFSNDGIQITDLGTSDSKANAIAIQSDGKILVAGSVGGNSGIARYNVDGSLDNSFNAYGIVITNFGSSGGPSMALQGDGKILIGGTGLARYNPDGTLDLSFSGGGNIPSFQDGTPLNCYSVGVQNDGKIVIAGKDTKFQGLMIARFNTNGSADNSFNGNGQKGILSKTETSITVGNSIAIQSDGKILVGGYDEDAYVGINSPFMLTRLNTNGAFDPTFNGGEIIYTYAGSIANYGTSVLIQHDNKILLGGYLYNGSSTDFAILRYNVDGSLDATFNGDGIDTTEVSSAYDRLFGMALDNESLYAVGFGQYPGNLGVVVKYAVGSGGVLPVTLTDFTAEFKNKSVVLQWQTASEYNLSGFIIERSADGNNFSRIDNVAAKGNNNIKINYSALDQQPLQGINFYRLKIMDIDGKFTYSKIVAVNINNQLLTLNIFPNPASAILFVQASGENEKAIFRIIDISGRKIQEEQVTLNRNSSFSININTLSKGTYILQLYTKEKIESRKFVKK